jgi:LysM repeat protein
MTAAELDLTESVCPFLGLPDDPRSHFTFPDRAHRCWAKKKPATIEPSYQASFCLGQAHTKCDRFNDADQPLPTSARLMGAAPLDALPPASTPVAAAPLGSAPPMQPARSTASVPVAGSDTKPAVMPSSMAPRPQPVSSRAGRTRRVGPSLIGTFAAFFSIAVVAAVVIGAISILRPASNNPGNGALVSPSPPVSRGVTSQPSPSPDSPAATMDAGIPSSLAPTPSVALGTPASSPAPSSTFTAQNPTPSLAPSPTPFLYTIQRGDNLISIARRFHVDPKLLQKVNHLKDPSLIFAGNQLIIPIDPSQYPDISPSPNR